MKQFLIRAAVIFAFLLCFDQMRISANLAQSKTRYRDLPQRFKKAVGGKEFLQATKNMSEEARETAILREIQAGNVPDFLRRLIPIELSVLASDGKIHSGTIWVMPDYIAVGSNTDYVRIPMNPHTASLIAEEFDFILPTPKLVDLIYQNAKLRLNPSSLPPTSQMSSNEYYYNHNESIEKQLAGENPKTLISGHKKDVVLTKQLNDLPGRVAIYGWHKPDGKPIQNLSLVHGENYADYSHGIRFIRSTMLVDGQEVKVMDVLKDPVLSALISNEGKFEVSYR